MSDNQDDSSNTWEAEVFDALGHPTRIRLLQILAEKPLPFSALKRAAGLESNGLLTFHLGRLRGLVKPDQEGSYVLTDEGKEALRMIEVSRIPRSDVWSPPHVDLHLPQRRTLVVGMALLIVGLISVGALLGNAYVNDTNAISSINKQNSGLESYSRAANATIATESAEIVADSIRIHGLQDNISSLLSLKSNLSQENSEIQLLKAQVASLNSQVSSLQAGCGQVITTSTTLDKNIGPCSYGDGLILGASNVVIDCAGHVINGTSSANSTAAGVKIVGVSKVTIRNCFVSGFHSGFLLNGSSGNTLSMNTAKNDTYGFVLDGSSGNTLSGNLACNDEDSFDILSSSNNVLVTNVAVHDFFGFALYQSSNNILSRDTSSNNTRYGFALWYASFNVLTNGTASGNLMCGFFLKGSDYNNTLGGNAADRNAGDGFCLYGPAHDVLSGNTANGNMAYGFDDLSAGSGTSGTGDVYSGDNCSNNGLTGSNPAGLCSPQP